MIERKPSSAEKNISGNSGRVGEAETRIATVEEELQKTLATAMTQLACSSVFVDQQR